MTATSAPCGPRGLAVRCAAQGKIAGRAGAPYASVPYGLDRPFSRRAWFVGYVIGARSAGYLLPTDLEAPD